jgi:hypothetical protein
LPILPDSGVAEGSGGLHESGQANRRTCNGSVPAFEGLSSTVIDGIVEDETPGAIKSVIQLGACNLERERNI